jgi:radical SAM protein with 4Fe4S-binding SPASM domain
MTVGSHNVFRLQEIVDRFLEEYNPSSLGVNMMKPPTPDRLEYEYMIDPFVYTRAVYRVFQNVREYNIYMELVDRHVYPFVHRVFRHFDCGAAAGTTINLDSRGRIGPCKSLLIMEKEQVSVEREDLYGFHQDIIARWHARSPVVKPSCRGCPALGICGGGCAYEAYSRTGDPRKIDEASCRLTREFLDLMIWDLYSLVKRKYAWSGDGIFIPSRQDRKLLYGRVAVQPFSLKYSVGHATPVYKMANEGGMGNNVAFENERGLP